MDKSNNGIVEATIFSQIRQEASDFYDTSIEVVPGWSFNQYYTLKRIYLYLNNKYENGETYLGKDKIFFDIVNAPCEVATKMLNLDSKHIRLWPLNPKSYFSTYLLEKELKLWLKKSKMGKILNVIAEEAPRFGSVMLEKTKDGAEVIDLRKLICDQTMDDVQKMRFVTTIHYMSPSELMKTNWDNKEIAIENFSQIDAPTSFEDVDGNINQSKSTPLIKVYRRFGEVPESWLDPKGSPTKLVKSLFIVAGADVLTKNSEGKPVGEAGVVLFKSKWSKEWPFKDFHYRKIRGRWLGVGVIEMLFDAQVRMNELKNQKRISMELSTMHLFQTRDKTITRNVITDLQNGDVLYSPNGIEPIVNEERNLAAFQSEEDSYKLQVDRLTFAYDAVRGESMPSSTPATNALISQNQSTSVFGFKRENLALMYQDYFNDLVMPQLLKDMTAEHIMRFVGTSAELQKIDDAAAEIYANDIAKEAILNGRDLPDLEALKIRQRNELKKLGESRFLQIKEGLYNDAEFEFDFNITNEQVDPAIMVQNTQAVLTPLLQQYGLDDPRVKVLFNQFAQALGVSPAEMELADQQSSSQPQQMMQGQMPMQGQQPQQVGMLSQMLGPQGQPVPEQA